MRSISAAGIKRGLINSIQIIQTAQTISIAACNTEYISRIHHSR